MIEEIFLTILIILFINICLFEDKLKPKESISIQRVRSYLKTISLKKFVLSFILPLFLIILYLWLLGIRDFLTIYLYTGISLLILLHTFWLFGKIQKSYFILFLILSVFTIFARAIIPIEIIRDLFVILAITWLGPVITSFKFFKKNIFIIISILWCLYDVIYVLLSNGYNTISTVTNNTGISLYLSFGNADIGLADLFYISLLISIIQKIKYKFIAIFLIITSYLILLSYVYFINPITVFPLLLLWVPCGLIALLIEFLVDK